ncbi:MAG TPA: sigma 54-interacting transcriptional regulator [Kofleriaceae bacterium]|nr:sigma 54-interacting transcriptional regulator [Kofleriaceae bacterium]
MTDSSTRIVLPPVGDTEPERAGLSLVVLGDDQLATHPLPAAGSVTIGRSATCDIAIFDKSISRQHAVLRLGEPLTIEDTGSANGTRVAGGRIVAHAPTHIRQGEVVELGDVSILVQRRTVAMPPRRLWSHGYFEGRLADECARATEGTAFSVVFLHCEARPPLEAIQGTLAALVRQIDVAGEYGAGEYEVLLVDTGAIDAEHRAAAIVDRLHRHGVAARAGVASFPRDGRSPDQLLAHASARARPSAAITQSGFVVEDRAMIQLRRVIDRVAAGTLSVLLLGETGVGKEVLAELVHRRSPRKARPFLRLNCAAVTDSLLESELFGHEKGAFTGAVATKPGLLETANGGTVFLDEIGEISAALQVKLLRVLEERIVMRVGGLKGSPIDVRFVAATNRDLEQEIARGRFRQDLYYRLAGITLVIPPLRERVSEIVPLVQSFIANASTHSGRSPQISREALALLEAYSWPGNIRELRNVVERAVLLCSDGVIRPEHLPLEKMQATYPAVRAGAAQAVPVDLESARAERAVRAPDRGDRGDRGDPGDPADPADLIEPTLPAIDARGLDALYPGDAERDRIVEALEVCRGNQTRAAAILGMSRRTLISRIERYGLPRPRKPGKGVQ